MNFSSRMIFAFSLFIGLAVACGNGDEASELSPAGSSAESAPKASAAADSRTPEEVARAFMDAGNAGDRETFLGLLTPAARTGLGGDGEGFSLEPDQFQDIEIGAAQIDGQEANVPVSATQQGAAQDMTLKLRQEADAWRVYGMEVKAGEMAISMNFEELGQMVEQMAEGMGTALKESFETSMSDWQAGGSAEEIAAERKAFDATEAISEETYRSYWVNEDDFSGKTVGNALRTLSEGLGLDLEVKGTGDALEAAVEVEVAGISNLEAIERLCGQVGMYPEYPDLQGGMAALGQAFALALAEGFEQLFTGDSGAVKIEGLPEEMKAAMEAEAEPEGGPSLTLKEGERPYPVAFAGPFMIEVLQVDEQAPHATGTLSLRVSTFGMNPSLLERLADDGQGTSFNRIVDAQGRGLTEEGVRYMSGGEVIGAAYHDLFNISLMNLLRAVTAIDAVKGVQRVNLPLEVLETTLEQPEAGMTAALGPFTLEVKEVGDNSRIDIAGPEEAIKTADVLMAADDTEGNPLGITYQDAMQWMPGKLQATLNTPSAPAVIHLKLFSKNKMLEYPFKLGPIPLQKYEQMPEKLVELDYGEAEAPLTARFIRFTKDDPNFPEIEIEIVNHSNKDVTSYFANLVYLDAAGQPINDFPMGTTITGDFSSDGFALLAAAGETKLKNTTAFSMPEGTEDIRIEPNWVDFVDGTKWEPEP